MGCSQWAAASQQGWLCQGSCQSSSATVAKSGNSSRLRGLPEPSTILGFYLTTSHRCSETPRCHLGQARPLGWGAVSLGLGVAGGWTWEGLSCPFRMMVSDLRSNTSLSAARSPVCPEQPYLKYWYSQGGVVGANYSVLFYFPPLQGNIFPWCNNSLKTQRGRALGFPSPSQGLAVPKPPPAATLHSFCRASVSPPSPFPPYLAGVLGITISEAL